jgi:hypothetical protein
MKEGLAPPFHFRNEFENLLLPLKPMLRMVTSDHKN